jgi:uncharacterized membrane protein
MVNVLLTTTPDPTSGFLSFVPKRELIHLDMTIEEGMKMVISGGIVGPAAETADEPCGALSGSEPGDRVVALEQSEEAAERPPARAVETRVES